ncbi:hypothetical protein CK203_002359 [Vitis vinifera]|uniref:Uncharacterized protein n=1 Tax=Vitis vinifera TaxID=29760 RepID=A0A438KK93_VITVI|nr:hypothetical protein CK203_002359 [Vitis vinifera]
MILTLSDRTLAPNTKPSPLNHPFRDVPFLGDFQSLFWVLIFLVFLIYFRNRLGKVDPVASLDGINSVVDSVATLNINPDVDLKTGEPTTVHNPVSGISDCKCGMPLCICEVPAAPVETVPLQRKTIAISTTHLNPKPKKTDCNLKNRGSTSNSKHGSLEPHMFLTPTESLAWVESILNLSSDDHKQGKWLLSNAYCPTLLVSNLGQVSNSSLDKPQMDYDANGEGLREAIKNSDTAAVKKLLSQAALFNQTDIAFILMESGASLEHKNAQGKDPCTPVLLNNIVTRRNTTGLCSCYAAVQDAEEDGRRWAEGLNPCHLREVFLYRANPLSHLYTNAFADTAVQEIRGE